MAQLNDFIQSVVHGISGRVPVFDNSGKEVGFRSAFSAPAVNLATAYATLPAGTVLKTKGFMGQDIAVTIAKPVTANGMISAPITAAKVGTTAHDLAAQPPFAVPAVALAAGGLLLLMLVSRK
jgi:hypothetical protein